MKYIVEWDLVSGIAAIDTVALEPFSDYEAAADYVRAYLKGNVWRLYEVREIASKIEAL